MHYVFWTARDDDLQIMVQEKVVKGIESSSLEQIGSYVLVWELKPFIISDSIVLLKQLTKQAAAD